MLIDEREQTYIYGHRGEQEYPAGRTNSSIQRGSDSDDDNGPSALASRYEVPFIMQCYFVCSPSAPERARCTLPLATIIRAGRRMESDTRHERKIGH